MKTETAQIIAGGAYCAGYLHGRRAAEREYESCTYWPLLLDPVVAAYCRTLRLVSYRYPTAIAKSEKACHTI